MTDKKIRIKQRILFGLRLCDLNAVKIQDQLFINPQFTDDHYKAARESIFLVGWYCNTPPSKFCFCESMNLTHYYDLMLRDLPTSMVSRSWLASRSYVLFCGATTLSVQVG